MTPAASVASPARLRGPIASLWLVAIAMVTASLLAWWMTPTRFWAEHGGRVRYETLFPDTFGDWHVQRQQVGAVVNPQEQESLAELYDEVVSRVYQHKPSGRRLMISLAYGANQSRATQVHKPEVCYPAQGFTLLSTRKDTVALSDEQPLPVMRLVARMGQRNEPIVYWIRAGDRVVRGSVEQNLARVALGLRGYIPDGLLFRVSEISPSPDTSFPLQDRFIRDFLALQSPQALELLIGERTR